jgi:hypothetical protein
MCGVHSELVAAGDLTEQPWARIPSRVRVSAEPNSVLGVGLLYCGAALILVLPGTKSFAETSV